MKQIFGIRSRLRIWVKPARDPQYRRWIKSLPCFACGRNWLVDPAHTGPHGISQKASDYNCIPLCRDCHQSYDKAPYDFQHVRSWDMPAVLAIFHHLYLLKTGRDVRERFEERRAA